MAKFFSFTDRSVPVQFLDGPAAVTVKLTISDETDRIFVRAAELVKAGAETSDVRRRMELWIQAVDTLIGTDARGKILEHAPVLDCFAVAELYRYLVDTYAAAKVKNLSASAR